jgi:hypothetical protein
VRFTGGRVSGGSIVTPTFKLYNRNNSVAYDFLTQAQVELSGIYTNYISEIDVDTYGRLRIIRYNRENTAQFEIIYIGYPEVNNGFANIQYTFKIEEEYVNGEYKAFLRIYKPDGTLSNQYPPSISSA